MRITVFGATGAIGYCLVERALEDGFHVKAYIKKFSFSNNRLELIKGELDDYDNIRRAVSGSDAVISTLAPELVRHYSGTPLLDGHKNIIRAMHEENVSRLITLCSPAVKSPGDRISAVTVIPALLTRLLYPDLFRESRSIGRVLTESGLEWTAVRIIAPNDNMPAGDVAVSFGDRKIGWQVSREDAASFLLHQVADRKYIRSMPIIGSRIEK